MMLKAEIIVGAANRLWGMRDRELAEAIRTGNIGCIANDGQEFNSKWKSKLTFESHFVLPKTNLAQWKVLIDRIQGDGGRR